MDQNQHIRKSFENVENRRASDREGANGSERVSTLCSSAFQWTGSTGTGYGRLPRTSVRPVGVARRSRSATSSAHARRSESGRCQSAAQSQ